MKSRRISRKKNHIPKGLQILWFLQILNVHESQKAKIFTLIIDKNVQLVFILSREDYMILNTHLKIQKVNVLKRLVKRKIFIEHFISSNIPNCTRQK